MGDACLDTLMWMLWDNTSEELLGRLDQSVLLDTSISVPDSEILESQQYHTLILLEPNNQNNVSKRYAYF